MSDDITPEGTDQPSNSSDQTRKETPPQKTGKNPLDTAIAVIGAVVGALFGIAAIILLPFFQTSKNESNWVNKSPYYERTKEESDSSLRRSDIIRRQTERGIKEIDSMVTVLERMNDSLTIVTRPSDDKIIKLLTSLDSRLTKLEKVLMDNPEKAVALPLLKRDIDNLKTSQDVRIELLNDSLSTSIDRLYTVIGTVTVVIGVGLVAALYATISAKRQEKKPLNTRRQ